MVYRTGYTVIQTLLGNFSWLESIGASSPVIEVSGTEPLSKFKNENTIF